MDDSLLQHERTALAWERNAIACVVVGLLFVRTASSLHLALTVIGFAQVGFGSVLLVWAGYNYDSLHGPLRASESPVRPTAARVVGLGVATFSGLATLVTLSTILTDL